MSDRLGYAAILLVVVVVLGVAFLGYTIDGGEGERVGPGLRTPAAVATAGEEEPEGTDDNSGPAAVVPPPIIQKFQMITDAVDGRELVGRRVHLQVNRGDITNHVAFWVGEPDDQVLVVLGRDNRDGAARQRGDRPLHRIAPLDGEQPATISGTVRLLPRAEEMFSWGLSNNQAAALKRRPIYIHADTVTTTGGT